jgi:GNAT superfamily N-acetyltransferase
VSITIRPLTGPDLLGALDALAELRIRVFAEWPYLYDGDPAYEVDYLRAFAAAPYAVLVAALDGARIVGAATASPMGAQSDEVRTPFEKRGIATGDLFYFGESVLLSEYRGQGIGHAFFDAREVQARASGAHAACFAAVVREENHPARPADYRPLEGFWRRRGYQPVPGLVTDFAWRDHGEAEENPKPMQFWLRRF